MNPELIRKYNVAAPRYTSYPTVPCWDTGCWTEKAWMESVSQSYGESKDAGISLYIHLPFCESLCTYCGCTTRITKNHGVEEPYITAIIKEWLMYCSLLQCKPRVREIHLGGGTPTFFSPANLRMLMDGILENAEIPQETDFGFEAHPANTTPEHLQILYNCGFRRLSLGIQDFDPAVQEVINRRQTVEQVEHVCMEARKIGYTSVNFDLVYGLPKQNVASIGHTVKEVLKLSPDRIAYYSYAHVPWIKPAQRSFLPADLPDTEQKLALYERGRELFTAAGYHDIGMDHFATEKDALHEAYRAGTLHRNFMGYTPQHTQLSIGLGISSISDSWYAFAQNTKSVETYLENMAAGRFAFVKGHILSQEDRYIRRHILNIMCTGNTRLSLSHPLCSEFIAQLIPLAHDGLVRLEEARVEVTETGRSFLRNVCMCFDRRLSEKMSRDQVFSMSV